MNWYLKWEGCEDLQESLIPGYANSKTKAKMMTVTETRPITMTLSLGGRHCLIWTKSDTRGCQVKAKQRKVNFKVG